MCEALSLSMTIRYGKFQEVFRHPVMRIVQFAMHEEQVVEYMTQLP
jgi:hypothetical protein